MLRAGTRLCFKPLCIQFTSAICHPILLFGTTPYTVLGTQEYAELCNTNISITFLIVLLLYYRYIYTITVNTHPYGD